VPSSIVVNLNSAEQACLREQRRRLRLLCPLLRWHILLLLAQQRSPTEIANWLLCSRFSVYEMVTAWRKGGRAEQPEQTAEGDYSLFLAPSLQRSLRALLQKPPVGFGWCRTRWSGAALALTLEARRGFRASAETVRRWLHGLGWRWKRTKLIAKDNDPQRATKLAAIRLTIETLRPRQALLFADELDLQLLPKTGNPWMPKGTQTEVLTPAPKPEVLSRRGWDVRTGVIHPCFGERKTNALFRQLLDKLQTLYPAQRYDRIYVVADNYRIHKAQAVQQWWAAHPRFELCGCPLTVPAPIRSNGPSATLTTKSHAITNENAGVTWWPM
jgi:transposase